MSTESHHGEKMVGEKIKSPVFASYASFFKS